MKPKNWYVDKYDLYTRDGAPDDPDYIHIIEYSAYQKAVEALKDAAKSFDAGTGSAYPNVTNPYAKVLRELGEIE